MTENSAEHLLCSLPTTELYKEQQPIPINMSYHKILQSENP